MLACSWDCDYLFVYQLGEFTDDCSPTVLSEVNVAGDAEVRFDAGAGDNKWGGYNSLAVFSNESGEVFMLGGHQGWLDRRPRVIRWSSGLRHMTTARAVAGRIEYAHGQSTGAKRVCYNHCDSGAS